MNRRDFLKSVFGIGVASLLPIGIFNCLTTKEVTKEITILPADDPKKLRLGWVVYEEVGFAVINDHALSKIVVA